MFGSRARRRGLSAVCATFTLGAVSFLTPGVAASAATPAPRASGWIRDTVQVLNIFLPDGASDYFINGFGTADGARTVISGRVPTARYWSFTAYPSARVGSDAHIHDTEIHQSDGHYRVTLAMTCAGVTGTCVATASTGTDGYVVMRLYVPVDLNGAGTGGVPLPTVAYESARGQPLALAVAAGSTAVTHALDFLTLLHGQLPAALTRPYPAPAPVPTPVKLPLPVARVTAPRGPFANPDNLYAHMTLQSSRGNLLITTAAPTYQSDATRAANRLGRIAGQSPQVRYWSVCVTFTGRATGDCLHDEQVHVAPNGTFTLIVSPTCPVAGYVNCLAAGPEPIQTALAFRNLLPSTRFASHAFRGRYAIHGTYVARPG
jgi:hypothetical protein